MGNSVSIAAGLTELLPTATQLGGISATSILTASQGGTGLSAITSGYTVIGNGTTTLTQIPMSNRLIAYSNGVVLTATGDQALTMTSTNANYIVRRVTVANATAALATILAVALLRTASGGGGSAITGAIVFTGLTATNTYLDQAVTLASTQVSSTQLYVNITTAIATAQTLPCYVFGDYLP